MLRWNAVLMVLFLATAGLRAGKPPCTPHGAAEAGLAFSVTATPGHWSSFNNQALLTKAASSSFSVSFTSLYTMPGLTSKAASIILSAEPAPLGVIVSHYGNGDYYRLFAGIGSAVKIAGGVSLGLQADYLLEHGVGEYRDIAHLTFETGLVCSLGSPLDFGIHIFNPLGPLNSLPSSIDAGLCWRESDDLFLNLSCSAMTGEPLSLQCGMSWKTNGKLTLRCGYMSSPSAFAFGAGIVMGAITLDSGCLLNGMTGITSSISLIWRLR